MSSSTYLGERPVDLSTDDGITLEELFEKILNYQDEWIEQEICIQLIQDYRSGLRWTRKDII